MRNDAYVLDAVRNSETSFMLRLLRNGRSYISSRLQYETDMKGKRCLKFVIAFVTEFLLEKVILKS